MSLNKHETEASSHDRIKMIKFWLEYDQKIFTPMIQFKFGSDRKIISMFSNHLCKTTHRSNQYVTLFMHI